MAGYVTLVNPRRRHRRRYRRNPSFGMPKAIGGNLPGFEEVLGATLGATVATALPPLLKLESTATEDKDWLNIAASLGGTIIASIATKMVWTTRAAQMAAVGGGLITFLKATHKLSEGKFGIPPSTKITTIGLPGTTGIRGGIRALPPAALPSPASAMNALAPATRMARPGVAAFKESEFRAAPPSGNDPLLV